MNSCRAVCQRERERETETDRQTETERLNIDREGKRDWRQKKTNVHREKPHKR